jgi:SAM-dependent methyltransferase
MYYADKLPVLKDIFGTPDVAVTGNTLSVRGRIYPIVNDVIILGDDAAAPDIQFTFGREWETYSGILPEHQKEFFEYFDIVDLNALKQKRVCDLGCGMGRWSYFLKDLCRELILVDFSDAIFVARRNLEGSSALFFKCDIKKLPFKHNFADFIFCLGVLHHLPTPCLDEVRALEKYSPHVLIYLYYALDNRPFYFRWILAFVTFIRKILCRIKNPFFRRVFSYAGTFLIYIPLILIGKALRPFGLSSAVPLYDGYHDKGARRIEQDVYDRFFTRIEQRVSRKQIAELADTFTTIEMSDKGPYWHFICKR